MQFEDKRLVISLQGDRFVFGHIVFRSVEGFRVLDERDLCEFWKEYNEKNGWLYEVLQGGWMELEKQRPLFNAPVVIPQLREFLIVDHTCVSVLSTDAPEVIDLGGD